MAWAGQAAASREAQAMAGNYGAGEARGLGLSAGMGSRGAAQGGPNVGSMSPDVAASAGRRADYNNVGNSSWDNIGNFFARMVGFNEMKPKYDPRNTNWNTNWGFDPAGLIGGAIGLGVGAPGLGLLADMGSQALGRPLQISMGPSVFGGGLLSPGIGSTGSAPTQLASLGTMGRRF